MLKHCLRLGAAAALTLAGLLAGLLLPRLVGWGGGRGGAAIAHTRAGPTLEQVRALSALTVLEVDVADVQVTDLRGYTGGVRAALVVKGDVTLSTDLSQAHFASLDAATRTAVLVLPPPRVGTPRVDHARTRLVWVWKYGLWHVVPGDRAHAAAANRALAEAQQVVAAAGREPSLDGRARAQAEAVLRALFEATGWQVEMRWSDRESGQAESPDDTLAATRPTDTPVPLAKGGGRMASDHQVSARHVLQSLMRLKRQGIHQAIAELEQLAPDLAGYLRTRSYSSWARRRGRPAGSCGGRSHSCSCASRRCDRGTMTCCGRIRRCSGGRTLSRRRGPTRRRWDLEWRGRRRAAAARRRPVAFRRTRGIADARTGMTHVRRIASQRDSDRPACDVILDDWQATPEQAMPRLTLS